MREAKRSQTEGSQNSTPNRRRHPRSVFTCPVQIKVIARTFESASFTGYLKDISVSGAGIEIDDPCGELELFDLKGVWVILGLEIAPRDERHILAYIKWARKSRGTSRVKMGVSFKNAFHEDMLAIQKVVDLKSKDQTMLWSLWEQYSQRPG